MINKYLLKDINKIHFRKLDSTSSFLKREYKNLKNLTFVSTNFQENGRGRMGRTWESLKNQNLMFSILIKDKELINKYDSLSLSMAVSIYKTLIKIGIKNVKIKWPNDVYVENKKISGILLEGITDDNVFNALIIGIGLNVNSKDSTNLDRTSVFNEIKRKMPIRKIKKMLYQEILNSINMLFDNNDSYLEIIRNNNYLLNKKCSALINDELKNITVLDINDDNSLKIEVDNKVISIKTGEITFHI